MSPSDLELLLASNLPIYLTHVAVSLFVFITIYQVQEYYGFLPLTAYLAVNYMDRFLSLHRLPVSSPPATAAIAALIFRYMLLLLNNYIHAHQQNTSTICDGWMVVSSAYFFLV